MAGWAGGQDLRKEIRSFVTRGVPDSTGKVDEEINWAEVDDLDNNIIIIILLDRWTTWRLSGIVLRAGSTTCSASPPPTGSLDLDREPREKLQVGCLVGVEPVPGEEERGGKVVLIASKGMGTGGGKVYVHLMAGRECKDKICRQTRRRKKSPI